MPEAMSEIFRMYVDESGDHAYNLLEEDSHRYLSLLGIWFAMSDYRFFSENLNKLKDEIFGKKNNLPVILHRDDIVKKRRWFGALNNKKLNNKFESRLTDLILRTSFTICCVIIDKKKHIEKYKVPIHPYHYCMGVLMERYCGWLKYQKQRGDIMVESRGKTEDIKLKEVYENIYSKGTNEIESDVFKNTLTSKDLKIKPKTANISGLQLADILAYPVKKGCLIEKGLITSTSWGSDFSSKIYSIVEMKFNRNELTQDVWGYGKKII